MEKYKELVAIVGLGAILPDALDVKSFWNNLLHKRYSISEVTPERWNPADYYDPDPKVPDKTYSKIGGWVRGFEFDWKRFRIPPKVAAGMDQSQRWAISVTEQALTDYGYPQRPLPEERTGVVFGTAMGGEMHYLTYQRISFPYFSRTLQSVAEFNQLDPAVRKTILDQWHQNVDSTLPPVTEDSMPGELANIVAGRVANVFNFHGPNFITDAACASSFAAVEAAVDLLQEGKVDAVITGGVDYNMTASAFTKFCKIGALSATGSRPFGEGADGFVMGEGAVAFLLKRLGDAERDGDHIYAVIRGIGGSSDGRGKGITAPNPIGQVLAMQRAWANAGLDPVSATLIEAHGTSTRVGDVVEVESLCQVFQNAARGSIALGSVKSNFGHLKGAAGGAGLLKSTLALYNKILPPTLNAERPNPGIDFNRSPFYLNQEVKEWSGQNGSPRYCGVSAYGFGGTNYHLVLEEHIPGRSINKNTIHTVVSLPLQEKADLFAPAAQINAAVSLIKTPLRGILAIGAASHADLRKKFDSLFSKIQAGMTPPIELPSRVELANPERLVIDYGSQAELIDRMLKAQKAFSADQAQVWLALQSQGIFRGSGQKPGKLAFLFPGQGSQYLNMGKDLIDRVSIVAEVFQEADRVMKPILGKPLSAVIFVDSKDEQVLKQAEKELMQTAITQPAMLTMDIALYHLLMAYGFKPEMVMGHSLGEYAGLIASGAMRFGDALEAVAARGREMSSISMEDNGWMAAVMAPYELVDKTLGEVGDYVVIANINSYNQCVIGGASKAVEIAIGIFQQKGYQAQRLPVSHAFHTKIVSSASTPLRKVLDRLPISTPNIPLVSNVTGEFYPDEPTRMKDLLEKQVASPVQWIKGLEMLYTEGARVFVEVGPKKALKGFVDDVLGGKTGAVSLFTNHPKVGELASFNQALCGLYASGFGVSGVDKAGRSGEGDDASRREEVKMIPEILEKKVVSGNGSGSLSSETIAQIVAQVVRQVWEAKVESSDHFEQRYDRHKTPLGSVVISGTGLGLPGAEKAIMDPLNVERILRGEQFIDLIPERFRKKMAQKVITRVVKSEDGSGQFKAIAETDDVIRLAGRPGSFNLAEEYGVPEKLIEALDMTSQLAMAAGLDALREAEIPLLQTFHLASNGKYLPDRWLLPEALRDETGVIFASAFPGGDRFAGELSRYYTWQNRLDQLKMLEELRLCSQDQAILSEISQRMAILRDDLEREPYEFDRRFIFRILSMGHSQFAEYIGARGPNTSVNAACASTTQAIALAEDWIRDGRCRRVIVIAADYVTGNNLMEWVGAGMLATGAAATDDRVEDAALPFDARRHGTVIGMGACGLVLESQDACEERGVRGIVELLSSEASNSAYHGTRLDTDHVSQVMENLVHSAERRFGLQRYAMASQMVFMSHETYTPARGGSASAEVAALRKTFGEACNQIVVANTKGFTGHAMGVGVEDVIAIKILEYGIVPPVPNFKEVDLGLGLVNLSRGGRYPVQFALHLAAGFGSQIAMNLLRRIPGGCERVEDKLRHQRWLAEVSGLDKATTEVVKRVLRIKNEGVPSRAPTPSQWQPGTGPARRTPGSGEIVYRTNHRGLAHLDGIVPAIKTEHQPVKLEPITLPEKEFEIPKPVQSKVETEIKQPVQGEVHHETVPQATAPTQVPAVENDPVKQKLLEIVSSKTGYPLEMLDLDLDMEADLGIDTVKQAEIFLAIREAFDIPAQSNLKLRDYPTLAHTVQFVYKQRPEFVPAAPAENKPQPEVIQTVSAPTPDVETQPPADQDPVTSNILGIVSEKTGYPVEMLDLDLDMEADLGIDTVKQAETFLAIRQAFDIPPQTDLKLRDYPTLAHTIKFVYKFRPELAPHKESPVGRGSADQPIPFPPEPEQKKDVNSSLSSDAPVKPSIILRVPKLTLRPGLDLCKSTGVMLDNHSRVLVKLDEGEIGKALVEMLEHRGVHVLAADPSSSGDLLEKQVKAWLEEGPVTGVYWLPALTVEPALDEMSQEIWSSYNQQRVKDLAVVMRALYDQINLPGSFLVTATSLGGLHGYGLQPAAAPLGGAVIGFAKAYKREQPQSLVKAVDFEIPGSSTPATVAEQLISETLFDPGIVEVGRWDGGRYSLRLMDKPLGALNEAQTFNENTVFAVTGAAGGITSAIVSDLATASRGVFYLLDIAQAPDAAIPLIELFRSNKEALKQKLISDAKDRGERLTPAKVEKQLLEIERQEAALRVVETIQANGGTAFYRCLNILDQDMVANVVDEIRQTYGHIDVLIHAAGIEISRTLDEKDQTQFDRVYDVKAKGLYNLLAAAKGLPIGTVLAFSSIAGRFGNAGQTDYSAANDLLCKIISSLPAWRYGTRGIAVDWTAWSGIGMATRGSIPKVMEMAGIDMLPPETGILIVRQILEETGFSGELVVAGLLGILTKEWDATGGLDTEKAAGWLASIQSSFSMVEEIKAAGLDVGLEVETRLDPKTQPFLYDHCMDGTPLLPGAMVTETCAQLAQLLAGAAQLSGPGDANYSALNLTRVEHENFIHPFKYYRMEPQTLYMNIWAEPSGRGEITAHAAIYSRRALGQAGMPVQEKLHFTADIHLSKQPTEDLPPVWQLPCADWKQISADEIYRSFFHGPAYRVLESARICENQAAGQMPASLPPDILPAGTPVLAAPRLIELCFQTAGIWEVVINNAMALPMAVRTIQFHRTMQDLNEAIANRQFYSLVKVVDHGDQFDALVIDENGLPYITISGYQTVRLSV